MGYLMSRRIVVLDTYDNKMKYRNAGVDTEISMTGGGPHSHTLSDISGDGTMAAVDDAASDGKIRGRKNGMWVETAAASHTHTPAEAGADAAGTASSAVSGHASLALRDACASSGKTITAKAGTTMRVEKVA